MKKSKSLQLPSHLQDLAAIGGPTSEYFIKQSIGKGRSGESDLWEAAKLAVGEFSRKTLDLRLNRARKMRAALADVSTIPIAFLLSGELDRPYWAICKEQRLEIRINDYPTEQMYSLFVAGKREAEFNDWPAAWKRPRMKELESITLVGFH